jgi:hypothetical protein
MELTAETTTKTKLVKNNKYTEKADLWLLNIWFWHREYNELGEVAFELSERGFHSKLFEV